MANIRVPWQLTLQAYTTAVFITTVRFYSTGPKYVCCKNSMVINIDIMKANVIASFNLV